MNKVKIIPTYPVAIGGKEHEPGKVVELDMEEHGEQVVDLVRFGRATYAQTDATKPGAGDGVSTIKETNR